MTARAIVSDFGGVLTSPLLEGFLAVQEQERIPLEELFRALQAAEARHGTNPLYELERGRIREADFLARLERELRERMGRDVSLKRFADVLWAAMRPNDELFDFFRRKREAGLRLVLCTNNVREWEPRWRSMLPIDEVFHSVVDSAFVGVRKPEKEIYELALAEAGAAPGEVVFVDDIEENVTAAEALGMRAVHFRDTEQAIREIDEQI